MLTKSKAKPKSVTRIRSEGKDNARLAAESTSKSKTKGAVAARSSVDWRDETLDRIRALIMQAEPGMTEERKWRKASNNMMGVPVWSHNGIVCTGETYKEVVKLTFARGASLPDPSRLFNSGLDGGTRRAIDIRKGEKVDPRAFKALVKAAVALNGS